MIFWESEGNGDWLEEITLERSSGVQRAMRAVSFAIFFFYLCLILRWIHIVCMDGELNA